MSRDHSQNHYGPNASFDGYDSDLASAGILIESLRQQLAAAYEAGKRDASEDLEQAAFEKWLHDKCPSGDVESVQRQWLKSYEYAEFAGKLEQAAAGILIESLRQQLATCERQRDKLKFALENCRLFAARNRKESWALLILGFLAECGVVGSPLRDSSDHCEPDWTEYDGEYLK